MCNLGISGVHVFSHAPHEDERGSWQRVFDAQDNCLPEGLPSFRQISVSFNKSSGTFRGMHFLDIKAEEWKHVAIAKGAVSDFLLDTRTKSPTYAKSIRLELSELASNSVLIPPGVAHGFLTLEANTTLVYSMTATYSSDLDRGYNWRSAGLLDLFTSTPTLVSPRDSALPLFQNLREQA